jgi:hypothetical protein
MAGGRDGISGVVHFSDRVVPMVHHQGRAADWPGAAWGGSDHALGVSLCSCRLIAGRLPAPSKPGIASCTITSDSTSCSFSGCFRSQAFCSIIRVGHSHASRMIRIPSTIGQSSRRLETPRLSARRMSFANSGCEVKSTGRRRRRRPERSSSMLPIRKRHHSFGSTSVRIAPRFDM